MSANRSKILTFKDVEALLKQDADTHISAFDSIPLEELNEQFVPMLMAVEFDAGLRLALVKKFVARKGDPNKTYTRSDVNDLSSVYPLHYLATLADGAEAIKILLEAGADQNVMSTVNNDTPITPIERAIAYISIADISLSENYGLNIMAFIKYANSPLDPVILGKIFYKTDRIKNEKIRNELAFMLVGTNADFAAQFRSEKDFPTSGNPKEERNFAVTEQIYSLASNEYWHAALLFAELLDKTAALDCQELGWIMASAIVADTADSKSLAKKLLALGAGPDSTVIEKPSHVLAADFVSKFPSVVRVCIPPLFIAARRKDQWLLRSLLVAGANPHSRQSGYMQDYEAVSTEQTIFDVLIQQNSWDLILDVINFTKVAIKPDALEAVQTAAAASQDPNAKAVVAKLQRLVETKVQENAPAEASAQALVVDDFELESELELQEIKLQENVRVPAEENQFAALPRQQAEVLDQEVPTFAPAAPDTKTLQIQRIQLFKQFIADFKKINENYLQDNFLANKKGSAEEQAAEIRKEIKAHPHGRVAIAANLAKKYPGKCDNTNDDFLVELRNEKFKHERLWVWMRFWKWGKHTVVHKGSENKQTFYRARTFETYVNKLTPIEKHKLADEMRTAATDEKNTSRSASAVRKLKQ
jgi:hypothetical protein